MSGWYILDSFLNCTLPRFHWPQYHGRALQTNPTSIVQFYLGHIVILSCWYCVVAAPVVVVTLCVVTVAKEKEGVVEKGGGGGFGWFDALLA